ncbi:MAG: phytoene/squalene synthase family protein [Luteimonas sp.]
MAVTQHDQALETFIEKWRASWPEWRIAEVFVPASQRDTALAWFALLQELTEAAWSGTDPAPGLAKLAWWQEELQGWSQGRRRHPLGALLQSRPAPWMAFSAALPALLHLRALPGDIDDALASVRPFAESVMAVEATLLQQHPAVKNSAIALALTSASLMAMHPAVAAGTHPTMRAALTSLWPAPCGPRARRIAAALVRARLSSGASQPLPQWRALWLAWRAARS